MSFKSPVIKFTVIVIAFLLAGVINLLYFFRANPQIKVLGIKLLGDRNLFRVMKGYKANFIPQQLIRYNTGNTKNIAVSWAFRPEYSVGFYPVPVVDDTDNDGKPEVYIGSYSRCIYSLDGKTGNSLWKWKLPFGVVGGRVVDLVDLDNDGKKEVVFGTHTTLPIRVYALKTGKIDNDKRLLWATNLSGDFLEGGLSVAMLNRKPIIVALTRDAPYSRGTFNVLKPDGSFLFTSIPGVDNCATRPAIGILPVSGRLSVIHGSHNVYNATFANEIVARDLQSGKILWVSPKIGDTGFQNHQLIDVNFDGKNEVIAFARDGKLNDHTFILNGFNGTIIKEVPWIPQSVFKNKKQLIVCQDDKTMCLSKDGKILYAIAKISFGIHDNEGHKFLFAISYVNKELIIEKYDAANGNLLKRYNCTLSIPDYKKISDYGLLGKPGDSLAFLTLADTDNDGNWDCLIQVKDFVVNIRLPEMVSKGTSPFAPLSFRNIDNGSVIYE
jgi:outer membrane protein assembly factor BamB